MGAFHFIVTILIFFSRGQETKPLETIGIPAESLPYGYVSSYLFHCNFYGIRRICDNFEQFYFIALSSDWFIDALG